MTQSERSDSDPTNVLVLQGGGALGSYQAGAYESLCRHDFEPSWIAGISIGAINAAIIAGNARADRMDRLRDFWEMVSSTVPWTPGFLDDRMRAAYNEASAATVLMQGIPGFFRPRIPATQFLPFGSPETSSHYDTAPLRETLNRLVDFERINAKGTRFSVGAVNVATGNLVYFDNTRHTIRPEHIMASAALPPAFPAIEIDGHFYWDGGIASNTPLDYVLSEDHDTSLVVFQVDLFSARGPLPRTMSEVTEREKDIRYSSRTRLNTTMNKRILDARRAVRDLLDKLPHELHSEPSAMFLSDALKRDRAVSVIHLINRRQHFDRSSKDYEFSRLTMTENWNAGAVDVDHSMKFPESLKPPKTGESMVTWDLTRDEYDRVNLRQR